MLTSWLFLQISAPALGCIISSWGHRAAALRTWPCPREDELLEWLARGHENVVRATRERTGSRWMGRLSEASFLVFPPWHPAQKARLWETLQSPLPQATSTKQLPLTSP